MNRRTEWNMANCGKGSCISSSQTNPRARSYRYNLSQKTYMIDFIEAHPELASGRYPGPAERKKGRALWTQLAAEMNKRGPKKSTAQWQKVWTDARSRSRARLNIKGGSATLEGNALCELDIRVVSLLDSLGIGTVKPEPISGGMDAEESFYSSNEPFQEGPEADDDIEPAIFSPEMVFAEEDSEYDNCSSSIAAGNMKPMLSVELSADVHYDNPTSSIPRDTENNSSEKNVYNSYLYKAKRVPKRPVVRQQRKISATERRQMVALENISRVMLLNAENEKERNKLMAQSLEIKTAQLKAEKEKNDILRDLLSTLKDISCAKNGHVC